MSSLSALLPVVGWDCPQSRSPWSGLKQFTQWDTGGGPSANLPVRGPVLYNRGININLDTGRHSDSERHGCRNDPLSQESTPKYTERSGVA